MKAAKHCAVLAVLAIATLLPQFNTLKISDGGLALIADAEGCRTSPYQCSAGVWTNGIGHTAGVTPQSHVSERQAAVNLVYDVMRVERGIDACMPAMPQPVYDAVVSFGFNVGVRAACTSTLAGFVRHGEWQRACLQLDRWVYVNGVRNAGLENRRQREKAWCLKGAL
ncbi:lysozyme [Erwinia sp. PsM31]|uniref:lysozyme n=1 Tax=Erwinia sp. PsM31 TaxID=3030535 RepID=UPI00263A9514|nr:lysozyme [Erwinia sp. PsM31]MDN4629116.1 lysozyme [Erwinia sp. PsM31]